MDYPSVLLALLPILVVLVLLVWRKMAEVADHPCRRILPRLGEFHAQAGSQGAGGLLLFIRIMNEA